MYSKEPAGYTTNNVLQFDCMVATKNIRNLAAILAAALHQSANPLGRPMLCVPSWGGCRPAQSHTSHTPSLAGMIWAQHTARAAQSVAFTLNQVVHRVAKSAPAKACTLIQHCSQQPPHSLHGFRVSLHLCLHIAGCNSMGPWWGLS